MGTNERRRRQTRKELFLIVLACLVITASMGGYLLWASQTPAVTISFLDPQGNKVGKYTMEIAADPASRAKGLMFRKKEDLAPNEGMLFLFPQDKVQSFWMKDTFIPLDMIFVDSSWKVVGIIEKVPPLNQNPRAVNKPSRYVIELNAGEASKLGLKEGWEVKVAGALPKVR